MAAQSEVMEFVGTGTKAVPIWLAVTYLSSNVVLNGLNFYWFGKMIETVRKRFEKKRPSKSENEGKDDKGAATVKGAGPTVKRRKSSLLLDVADRLEKDERLSSMMMDGAVKVEPGRMTMNEGTKTTAEQTRRLEDRLEIEGKSTALQNNNHRNDAVDGTTGDATRKR